MSTAADVARKVFEFTLSLVGARLRREISEKVMRGELVEQIVEATLKSLRSDFEQALIALRFELMSVQLVQLDGQVERDKAEAQAAYDRGKAIAEGMDIEVVDDPDATPKLGVPATKPDNE